MDSPESCKGCWRESLCDLWKSPQLRQEIEAEGCDYYSDHAPTNFERITKSPEILANTLEGIIDCATCPAEHLCAQYVSSDGCRVNLLRWLKEEA